MLMTKMINVTGIAEIDAKLDAMPASLRNKALRKGCREVAKITLKEAKARAPKKSGDLARSLVVKATKISRKNRKILVGVSVTTKAGMFQGTTQRKQKTTGRATGQIDKTRWQFLRPALSSFLERKTEIFRTVVAKWMTEQADKQIAKYNAARTGAGTE
jgi:HK97 gp10 family phage protein